MPKTVFLSFMHYINAILCLQVKQETQWLKTIKLRLETSQILRIWLAEMTNSFLYDALPTDL